MANRTIKFTHESTEYTLEFTRATVRRMENDGFDVHELLKKPATYVPELFAGAFLSKHRFVKRSVIDEIYSKIGNKRELLSTLIEMYNEPISSLLGSEDNEGDEGNIDWSTGS